MTTASTPALLHAKHLSLGFHERRILANVDLQVHAHECLVILGPSGVGKSTLLQCLAGLTLPTEGEIHYQGEVLKRPHTRLAVAFQDPALLPWLNVYDNVGFGLNFRHQPHLSAAQRHQRIQQALENVGLAHCVHLRPSELSGGMAQRVALARCLARQPEVLLLDEPFGALDAVTRQSMQQLLLRVRDEYQCTVVMITHDIDEALALATRLIVVAGSPANIVAQWQLAASPTASSTEAAALSNDHSAIKATILQHLHHAAPAL